MCDSFECVKNNNVGEISGEYRTQGLERMQLSETNPVSSDISKDDGS